MKIKPAHIVMFNAGKHPSANENVNAQTGFTREIYFKLRQVKDSCCGISGKITMADVKRFLK